MGPIIYFLATSTGDPLPPCASPAEYLLQRGDAKERHSKRLLDQCTNVPIRVHAIGYA